MVLLCSRHMPPLRILHVCSRDLIRELRDEILHLHGYQVTSTLSIEEAEELYKQSSFDLVLVDVEGDGRIPLAEKFCDDIRKMDPNQKIAFICNYRVSKVSDCPDEIIHSEFNPKALVEGVKEALQEKN
jgi:DNA-binding NtrC family response regulator